MKHMKILIISGLSGAGKSKAASFLEDMGFYIVDNMPAEMILKFAEFCTTTDGRYNRVALVYDVRTAENSGDIFNVLRKLNYRNCTCKMLFLEASPETIIKRYKETRRLHPLNSETTSLEEAVLTEKHLMESVREKADYVIDTTRFSTAQLRGELLRLFGDKDVKGGMKINILSFGYKYGLPIEADIVLDVRFMPNPYYISSLRPKTGLDSDVSDYVFSFQQTQKFMVKLQDMMAFLLPLYAEEGKTVLVIAIGCTGGRHRSVAVTHRLEKLIADMGYTITENHRDMTREN